MVKCNNTNSMRYNPANQVKVSGRICPIKISIKADDAIKNQQAFDIHVDIRL